MEGFGSDQHTQAFFILGKDHEQQGDKAIEHFRLFFL